MPLRQEADTLLPSEHVSQVKNMVFFGKQETLCQWVQCWHLNRFQPQGNTTFIQTEAENQHKHKCELKCAESLPTKHPSLRKATGCRTVERRLCEAGKTEKQVGWRRAGTGHREERGRENLLKGSIFVGGESNNYGNSIRGKPRTEAGH